MSATASSQDWFRSTYFFIWLGGSVAALIYVPTVSVVSRHDPLKVCRLLTLPAICVVTRESLQNEAHTFLAGGIGSLALTLFFVPIL